MLLPDFVLESRINQKLYTTGIDSLSKCQDKSHYNNYPYQVNYLFNSRGYRDSEWPDNIDELRDAIWCVGDSFTEGVGCPYTHTWPYLLQTKLGRRCINVSMDGASNQWISRKINRISEVINPKLIIAQWSFINRVESPDTTLSDMERAMHFNIEDNFSIKPQILRAIQTINSIKTESKVIHSFIPEWICQYFFWTEYIKCWDEVKGTDWPDCPKSVDELENLNKNIISELHGFGVYEKIYESLMVNDHRDLINEFYNSLLHIPEITKLDIGRDGYHYDVLTATKFVNDLIALI